MTAPCRRHCTYPRPENPCHGAPAFGNGYCSRHLATVALNPFRRRHWTGPDTSSPPAYFKSALIILLKLTTWMVLAFFAYGLAQIILWLLAAAFVTLYGWLV